MHLEFEDVYLQFLELFYQQQSITTADTISADHETAKHMADSNENVPKEDAAGVGKAIGSTVYQPTVRKRCSKKDRHSKINTARGPRDRRMRLSLDVARKFFDLQDLLGYDKASRTVDWLLKNSRSAIRELARGRGVAHVNRSRSLMGANSASSTSDDCEVVSSSNHSTTVVPPKRTEEPPTSCTKPKRTKKIKVARATVARESRRKARERARERTSQKRRLSETTEPKLLAESVFTHSLKESAGSHAPIYDLAIAEVENLSSGEARILAATTTNEVVANSLVYTGPWNPSMLFHYQDNAIFSHQHQQIEEFQFRGKPWEAYNSFNLSG
ncbi:hypothetical protein Pfo_020448 [Paulownia fortunei]|nr:hypothetical protein Pfo_020448 [Paulownia fortunei]